MHRKVKGIAIFAGNRGSSRGGMRHSSRQRKTMAAAEMDVVQGPLEHSQPMTGRGEGGVLERHHICEQRSPAR